MAEYLGDETPLPQRGFHRRDQQGYQRNRDETPSDEEGMLRALEALGLDTLPDKGKPYLHIL